MKNKIIERVIKHVEIPKNRVYLPPSAVKVLGLNKDNPDIVVTIYDNRVVLTKKE